MDMKPDNIPWQLIMQISKIYWTAYQRTCKVSSEIPNTRRIEYTAGLRGAAIVFYKTQYYSESLIPKKPQQMGRIML
jgi:hypothetical protein